MNKKRQLAHLLGGGIAMFVLLFLTKNQGFSLVVPSFGASAMLIFALGKGQPAEGKTAFWGHVLSALAGVATAKILGTTWYAVAIAVFLAFLVMLVTDTFHPPGGATAFLACDTGQGWWFVLLPVASGIGIMLLIRYISYRLTELIPESRVEVEEG
ncbi:HPP family protein [Carboxydocella sp. ULO1]|uniref:HPP family protein n=1 Tax=Carboxydocella sp. ULO1 TaxID=1926599 RepID=UPI0009AE3CEB|nr:HPP family protein [Carboxydocella sp. ULO1]GAW28596.1 HPP family protein [Carboxydocella sp. ULO1]